MLTPELVGAVGRTGVESVLPQGWHLTAERLIRMTGPNDWDGCYYELTPEAAERLANELNEEQPWNAAKRIKAIAGTSEQLAIEAPIETAEVVA